MDINVRNEDGTLNLNIIGNSDTKRTYFGKTVRTTQGGRTKVRWTAKINEITVTIEYLPDSDYKDLFDILESSDYIFITTEYGKKYKCVFIDEKENLTQETDSDGNVYWTGTINFKE